MNRYTYSYKSYGHIIGTWYVDIWESDIDRNNNTSIVNVKFYVRAEHNNQQSDTYNNYPSGYGSSTPYAKISIDGVVINIKTPACFDLRYNNNKKIKNGTTYDLGTASKKITHKADGNASVNISCYHYTSVSPGSVTCNGTLKLTKIQKYTKSSISVSSGTHNIGSDINVIINSSNDSLKHDIALSIAEQFKVYSELSGGNHNLNIPSDWKQYIQAGATATLKVQCDTYSGSTYIGTDEKTITIKNPDKGASISIPSGIYNIGEKISFKINTDNNYMKYSIVCKTNTHPDWIYQVNNVSYSTGTHTVSFSIPTEYKKGLTDNGSDNMTIQINSFQNGQWITENHVSTIIKNKVDEHLLYIKEFKETHKELIIDRHSLNIFCSWVNTYALKSVEFNCSGANSFNKIFYNVTSASCNWVSDKLTNPGINKIQVTITDLKGKTASSNIEVQSLSLYDYVLSINAYMDTSICVNLINGKLYKNHSKLGIRIQIEHSNDLKSLDINVDGISKSLNINKYTTEATFVTDILKTSGNLKVSITATDSLNYIITKEFTVGVYEQDETLLEPIISYVTEPNLFLSEGEKVQFTGSSKNIADYQIIYAVTKVDVKKATACCDVYENSYFDVDKQLLKSNLLNNVTPYTRYGILKDFDNDNVPFFLSESNNNKYTFKLFPKELDTTDYKYYALQWLELAEPGDLISLYVIERKESIFNTLYSTSLKYNEIPLNKMFNMCVLPLCPRQLIIYQISQTNKNMTIKFKNPIYNMNSGLISPIHTIDICLIAKDKEGNVINKSESRKRDVLNGKSWMYYSDNRWLNLFTKGNKYAYEYYTIDIPIDQYDDDTNFNVIGYYYTDWYNHPSIYSETNIISSSLQNIDLSLKIISPSHKETVSTSTPTFNIRVENKGAIMSSKSGYLYEKLNLAKSWDAEKWANYPLIFRVPRKNNSRPYFDPNKSYFSTKNNIVNSIIPDQTQPILNSVGCCTWSSLDQFWLRNNQFIYLNNKHSRDINMFEYPLYYTEFYNKFNSIYTEDFLYRMSDDYTNVNFLNNILYIKTNKKDAIKIGEINSETLLKNDYIDFTWTPSYDFIESGTNIITIFTRCHNNICFNNDNNAVNIPIASNYNKMLNSSSCCTWSIIDQYWLQEDKYTYLINRGININSYEFSITLYYDSFDFNYNYIDPLNYNEMMGLRNFLLKLASSYNINITPKWKTLIKNNSYLEARDYNDTVQYCIDLFTAIEKANPTTFKSDISKFKELPVIKKGERRSWATTPSVLSGKHCFPEWDQLINAIKAQGIFSPNTPPITETIPLDSCTWSVFEDRWLTDLKYIHLYNTDKNILHSKECCTWAVFDDAWLRYNQYIYLNNLKN